MINIKNIQIEHPVVVNIMRNKDYTDSEIENLYEELDNYFEKINLKIIKFVDKHSLDLKKLAKIYDFCENEGDEDFYTNLIETESKKEVKEKIKLFNLFEDVKSKLTQLEKYNFSAMKSLYDKRGAFFDNFDDIATKAIELLADESDVETHMERYCVDPDEFYRQLGGDSAHD